MSTHFVDFRLSLFKIENSVFYIIYFPNFIHQIILIKSITFNEKNSVCLSSDFNVA